VTRKSIFVIAILQRAIAMRRLPEKIRVAVSRTMMLLGSIALAWFTPSSWREHVFIGLAFVVGVAVAALRRVRGTQDAFAGQHLLREHFDVATQLRGVTFWNWDIMADRLVVRGAHEAHITTADDGIIDNAAERALQAIYPEDRELFIQGRERALREGSIQQTRLRICTANGARHVEVTARVFYDEERRPTRMLGLSLDITA
jgi:hypothetical protein